MSFRHPFQRLCYFRPTRKESGVLIAATGPYICSFDLVEGRLLSRWPRDQEHDDSSESEDDSGRPRKKQRVSEAHHSSDDSIEIVSERVKGQRRKTKMVSSKLPNVSHLFATRDGNHVIAVTTDDKCARVFKVGKNGRLRVLSER